jgi:hypothetical protein
MLKMGDYAAPMDRGGFLRPPFMALSMYRVMRQRLKDADSGWSPDNSALSQLERIQHHRIEVNEKPLTGISTLTQDQKAILMSLQVSKPTGKGRYRSYSGTL